MFEVITSSSVPFAGPGPFKTSNSVQKRKKEEKMPVDPNELLSRAQKNDAAGIQNLVSKGLNPRLYMLCQSACGCSCFVVTVREFE